MLFVRKPIGTCAYLGGLPSNLEEFTWSLAQMVAYTYEYLVPPGDFLHLDKAVSSYHQTARNDLAERMQGNWIIMLDTDHAFEPDLLARMVGIIQHYDVDVLSAVYRYKVHPHLPTIYKWHEESEAFLHVVQIDWSSTLVPVDCVGAGTLLVRRKVFERIREEMSVCPFDQMMTRNGPLSEDFSFFRRLMLLGIQAWVAPQIKSHHLMVRRVTDEDFDPTGIQVREVK